MAANQGKQMNILLLTGESGSGKSTTANRLRDELVGRCVLHYCDMHEFAFGDFLKEFTSRIRCLPIENFYGPEKELWRDNLKNVSDIVKEYDLLFFAKQTLDRLKHNIYEQKLIICNDWRFPYEIHLLRDRFRTAKIRTVRLGKDFGTKGTHNSERSIDKRPVDLLIDNTNLTPYQVTHQIIKRMEIWFPDLFNNTK